MVKATTNLSEKADKNVKLYMVENNISDKRVAINKICEDLKNDK